MENDRDYFRRRANEERAAAMKSPNVHARRTHLELADRYEAALSRNRDRLTVADAPMAGRLR